MSLRIFIFIISFIITNAGFLSPSPDLSSLISPERGREIRPGDLSGLARMIWSWIEDGWLNAGPRDAGGGGVWRCRSWEDGWLLWPSWTSIKEELIQWQWATMNGSNVDSSDIVQRRRSKVSCSSCWDAVLLYSGVAPLLCRGGWSVCQSAQLLIRTDSLWNGHADYDIHTGYNMHRTLFCSVLRLCPWMEIWRW